MHPKYIRGGGMNVVTALLDDPIADTTHGTTPQATQAVGVVQSEYAAKRQLKVSCPCLPPVESSAVAAAWRGATVHS